jgi:purine-binding chemotaxis protein CheW
MDNGQRPGGQVNAEALQQALRAFGAGGGNPAQSAELAALAQRMGLQNAGAVPAGVAPSEARGVQYVVIGVAGVEIALPATHVSGVERVGDITPVPNTVQWVLGVANLRGAITSVVDLRQYMGLPRETITSRSRVIVASAKDMIVGFLVDGVTEFRPLPDELHVRDTVRQQAPPWLVVYVDAVVTIAGRRIFVLDVTKLLFADSLHRYRSDT